MTPESRLKMSLAHMGKSSGNKGSVYSEETRRKMSVSNQVCNNTDLFYIDGYDPTHNVVLEYDGKYHHRPDQQNKDRIRQKKIIDILHPKKFWRFDSLNQKIQNVL